MSSLFCCVLLAEVCLYPGILIPRVLVCGTESVDWKRKQILVSC